MTKQVTATQAKAKLPALLDEVEQGEEIEVLRYGRLIARISPVRRPQDLKDRFKGLVKIHATDEEFFSNGEEWDCRDRRAAFTLGPPGAPATDDHYNDHMTRQLTVTELKAKLLAVMDDVEHGEQLEITRHGRLIARVIPARGPTAIEGMFAGVARTNATDEELFSTGEEWEAT